MPACDDVETETGHDLIQSFSSTPGHVIAAVIAFSVFMGIAARDILRLEAVLATFYSINNDRTW
jgi:hypothetical protein